MMTPEWVQSVITHVKSVAPKDFFGKVEINLQGGGVSNVNLITSIKDREGTENAVPKEKKTL